MKHRLLYGTGIMILVSLVGCGSENGLHSTKQESALVAESSREELVQESESSTTTIEGSHNETREPIQEQKASDNDLQPDSESEVPEENESPVADIENSYSEVVEQKKENASQTVYSATIEKQTYLPEEYMLTNVPDAEGLYVFLNGLSYSNETCDGLPEYSIYFDDGSRYYVNITEGWVWKNKKEARLTSDEIALISEFLL